MRIIPLQAIPNQTFTLQLSDLFYDLRIHDCGNIMSVSISVDNIPILTGARVVSGFPIIPYAYLEAQNGNFVFVSANDTQDEYPDWRRFNTDLTLIYASPEELRGLVDASRT